MTEDELKAIRERAEAATPGPWIAPTNANADTRFSAHAREDIPALLDEIDKQSAEIERLKGRLNLIACATYPVYCDSSGNRMVDVEVVRQFISIAQETIKGGE